MTDDLDLRVDADRLTGGSVRGDADGRSIVWDSGQFTGDAGLVEAANSCASAGVGQRLHPMGEVVRAGATTPLAAAAAIMAAAPGRMILTAAPQPVWAAMPGPDATDITDPA